MHCLTTSAVVIVGLVAAGASATIALGVEGGQSNIAWIYGDDPCNGVAYINPESQDPCGITFTLSNDYSYYVSASLLARAFCISAVNR